MNTFARHCICFLCRFNYNLIVLLVLLINSIRYPLHYKTLPLLVLTGKPLSASLFLVVQKWSAGGCRMNSIFITLGFHHVGYTFSCVQDQKNTNNISFIYAFSGKMLIQYMQNTLKKVHASNLVIFQNYIITTVLHYLI